MTDVTHRKVPISAVIICKNAETHIESVIRALAPCDEILIADTGSTDRTTEIVSKFPSVTCLSIPFSGFGPTKQHAVKMATHDWILSIDSDEIISETCLNACIQNIQSAPTNLVGRVLRDNYAMSQKIRYSGWSNDRLVRLFNRRHTTFSNDPVHESVVLKADSTIVEVAGTIAHFTVNSLDDFIAKTQFYTSLRESQPHSKDTSLTRAFLAALLRFIKTYLIQLGVLDGRLGLIISVANAQSVFWRHAKRINLRADEEKESR